MNIIPRKAITLFVCLLATSQTLARPTLNLQSIEDIIYPYVNNHAFEGAILVSQSGKVLFNKAYGYADRSTDTPTALSHSFQLASLSKPITASLVLALAQENKLSLHDPIDKYLKEYKLNNADKITLHHLLSHTSGIPDHFIIDGWFDTAFHKKTTEQDFLDLIAAIPKEFKPGEKYLYSNLGYFLIGKIIEKVTQLPYNLALSKYVLAPLKMENTGVAHQFVIDKQTVNGYQWDKLNSYKVQTPKNMSLMGAGAALYSNTLDLYKFEQALYDTKFLTLESKSQLFNPETPYSWRVGVMPITTNTKVNVNMYDGKFDGYSSMMTRFIDDKHSIIILSNIGTSYLLKQQLTVDLAHALYGIEPPNHQTDMDLILMNALFNGKFEHTLQGITDQVINVKQTEANLSSLAFQLLYSGLADQSLQLFSYIKKSYMNSTNAQQQFIQACNHRLTKAARVKKSLCDNQ